MLGTIIGLYLTLLLLTSLPSVQRWVGSVASRQLSAELETSVTVGKLRLGLFNRVVADDILILDQSGDTLLRATRLGAKIRLQPLLSGKIRLASVQLFGFDIGLKRQSEELPYNFQFIVDKLSNPDNDEPSKLDLAITSVVVRRGTISHDLTYKPKRIGFDVAHIRLEDISLKASLKTLTNDSCSLGINHLSFYEALSDTHVEDIRFEAQASKDYVNVQDFVLELPNTNLHIPYLTASITSNSITDLSVDVDGSVTLSDFQSFIPVFSSFSDPVALNLSGSYDGNKLTIPSLSLNGDGLNVQLTSELVTDLKDFHHLNASLRLIALDISASSVSSLTHIAGELPIAPQALGNCHAEGLFEVRLDSVITDAMLDCKAISDIGEVSVKGDLIASDIFSIDVLAEDLAPLALFAEGEAPWFIPKHISVNTHITGSKQHQTAKGNLSLTDVEMLGRSWKQLDIEAEAHPRSANLDVAMYEPDYSFGLTASLHDAQDFLTDSDLLNNLGGRIELNDVAIHDPDFSLDMQHMTLDLENSPTRRQLSLRSDFIDVDTEGDYDIRSLPASFQLLVHRLWPSLIPEPASKPHILANDIRFDIMLHNPDPLIELAHLDLSIPERSELNGILSVPEGHIELQAAFPRVIYGKEDLRDISLSLSSIRDNLSTGLKLQRVTKSGMANMQLAAEGGQDQLLSELVWDVPSKPVIRGTMTADTHFSKDANNQLAADIQVKPTTISIGDTLWHIREGSLALANNILSVNNLQVENDESFLRIGGRASDNSSDNLWVELQDINLGYILSFVNMSDVDLDAKVSGSLLAHSLFGRPVIEANVLARNFSVNDCVIGDTRAIGGWERMEPNTIDITADIIDPATKRKSHATCIIHPGHKPNSGIDLRVDANHLSAAFVGRYTKSFLHDFMASATGNVRLYGPFSALDLDGDLSLDTAAFTIPSLGVRYHAQGGGLRLRPGIFEMQHIIAYDPTHQLNNSSTQKLTNSSTHSAIVDGRVTYQHFKNIAYDINIAATDMLCYDFRDFGDMPFYATVYASGTAHLDGNASSLQIDMNGHPTSGTTLTYNASSPETTTDNHFITFKPSTQELTNSQNKELTNSQTHQLTNPSTQELTNSLDIRMNFDLNIQQDATMRLLMDQRTSDYITLNGHGNLIARYHNRGAFQLYGVYHVERGTYRLTMQDIMRKDFQFQPGGTLTFGGQPFKAALNLQAIYTVPSVSLNDLSAGSNISNTNVRVNCLMNIGGLAENPQVTFDFDIPNVNEDEKQMVRSLISTEEERNLQVIYLLGIGRFYTYDYTADQNRTSTAMNSLLSSTLSGQLNAILSNAIGTDASWNFGTNLSTGQQGWNEVDVEGMLSGRMLNNRLLFNGTFGYRDRPMTASNTNFVGDFDLQYLLTPSGNIRLKAYSETNDRYFTKSALTTQGVGILLRKDFNSIGELLRRKH